MSPHAWNLISEYIHQFQIIGNNINELNLNPPKSNFKRIEL